MKRAQDVSQRSAEQDQKSLTPIIITGYMHSGTTLAQQVMNRSSQVFSSYGESWLFINLPLIQRGFPDLNDDAVLRDYLTYILLVIKNEYSPATEFNAEEALKQLDAEDGITSRDIDSLVVLVDENRNHTTAICTVFEYLTRKTNRTHWMDKSPGYVVMLEKIRAISSDIKIIELVRDPRDVLASKLRRSKKDGNYDPILDTYSWRASIKAADNFRRDHQENILRVRYEDLAMNPQEEVSRMCEFVGIVYDEFMLDVERINTSTMAPKKSGFSVSSIESWRRTLPASDAFVCQQISKREMSRLGYIPEEFPITAYFRFPVMLGRSGINLLQRIYRVGSQEGLGHLLNRLEQYRRRILAQIKS